MNKQIDNMQKYENYKEQFGRLKKAMTNGFYLEAIFIEYAIMEDRLESALRHGGKWNPKPGKTVSIYQKVKKINKMAEQKRSLAQKYFSAELMESILTWKEKRNALIHLLMNQELHTEDLIEVAEEGRIIVNNLKNKVSCFNRALERESNKGE